MVRAKSSTLIGRSAERVFRFVAVRFFENYPRWSPEVIDLIATTPPPVRAGTADRQVRTDQGRRSESTFRVSAFEKDNCIAFQGTSNPFLIDYRFEPLGDSTNLSFTFELSRLEFFMRPFEKLIHIAVQDGAERVVHNIEGLIEDECSAN